MILERIKPIRDSMPNATWAEITNACHAKQVDLRATYQFKTSDSPNYIVNGISCAEIVVDILTGNYQLTRVDILEDVGESMSPNVDVGQVSAFVFL